MRVLAAALAIAVAAPRSCAGDGHPDGGIGVDVVDDPAGLLVDAVWVYGPSMGVLAPGDRIVAVDGELLVGDAWTKARALRAPTCATSTLTVLRGGSERELVVGHHETTPHARGPVHEAWDTACRGAADAEMLFEVTESGRGVDPRFRGVIPSPDVALCIEGYVRDNQRKTQPYAPGTWSLHVAPRQDRPPSEMIFVPSSCTSPILHEDLEDG